MGGAGWRPKGVGAHLRGAVGGRREDVDVEEEQLSLSQSVSQSVSEVESGRACCSRGSDRRTVGCRILGGGRGQTLRGRGGPGRRSRGGETCWITC